MPVGVAFNPEEQDVIDAIILTRGNLATSAKKLGVSRQCINVYLNENPHLWDTVHQAREMRDNDEVQLAIDTLFWFARQRESKPNLAFKAIIEILNRRGDLQKWQGKIQLEGGEVISVHDLLENHSKSVRNIPRNDQSEVEIEQPLQD